LIIAAFLEAIDGLIAALFSRQDLREKDDQGDPRRVDAGSPLMTDLMASGLDNGPGKKSEEWQPSFFGKLIAERLELEANGQTGRLGHGALLGAVMKCPSTTPVIAQGGRLHPEFDTGDEHALTRTRHGIIDGITAKGALSPVARTL
jgi:hypothetical protein